MTEKQFQGKVIKFLKSQPNTWFFKVFGGGYQRAGIPDLICCINGVFIAIELKGDNGKPTEIQKMNIRNINAAGGIGVILYPEGFKKFKKLIKEVNSCSLASAGWSALKNASFSSILDTSKD
ncbi:VRR-NUC domain-containing protein [Caminicella sporogenes DSM 14501]|uniref:VRR-NUC domain-containing protein n=1 Tax=Caminicella sporogenes DSM 14501 TaxID=1121266 RepID=A0A1M6RGP3_9FIRM|nr:VRR-NUC domain-containing protein [Caminicella sporogenes]RKD25230.1 VRR-NUC domain-containing protein [Caminicella sporogenes]SHK31644.1 VRR-NUC domain-containing protein [Caminicella sporogenes DSM 14501]